MTFHNELPFCPKNENSIKRIVSNITKFTGDKVKVVYTWKTSKIRSLFKLKDKVNHISNVIYKGDCSCSLQYVGETKRNVTIRWGEHNSSNQKSEPSKHLVQNPDHEFTWSIITKASQDTRKRKILETYYIATQKPLINDQLDIKSFTI